MKLFLYISILMHQVIIAEKLNDQLFRQRMSELALLRKAGIVNEVKTIADVGAYDGRWTKLMQTIFTSSEYFMIEGNPALEPQLKKVGVPYVLSLVGNETKIVDFYLHSQDPARGSVLAREAFSNSENKVKVKLPLQMDTIDNIIHKHFGSRSVDFLKINVEGYEFYALLGAAETLKNVTIVAVETSIRQSDPGSPVFTDINAFLEIAGFRLYDIAELKYSDLKYGGYYVQEEFKKDVLHLHTAIKANILWVKADSKYFTKSIYPAPLHSKYKHLPLQISDNSDISNRKMLALFCSFTDSDSINEMQEITSTDLRKNKNVVILNVCRPDSPKPIFPPSHYMKHLNIISQYFPGKEISAENTIVILAMDDTFWSVSSLDKVYDRYKLVRGSKNLVISTKMFCVISGEICTDDQVNLFYGSIPKDTFSPFINGGMVMGSPSAIQHLLTYFIEKNKMLSDGARDTLSYELLIHYYARRFPSLVAFDYHQLIFGSFPLVIPKLIVKLNQKMQPYLCRNSLFNNSIGIECSNFAPIWMLYNGFRLTEDGTCAVTRNISADTSIVPVNELHKAFFLVSPTILTTLSEDPIMWQALGAKNIFSIMEKQIFECRKEFKKDTVLNTNSHQKKNIFDPSKVAPPVCDNVQRSATIKTNIFVAVCDSTVKSNDNIEGMYNLTSQHFRNKLNMTNVCTNILNWRTLGFLNKPMHYLSYVNSLLQQQNDTNQSENKKERTLVLLMDSDTFWSIGSLEELILKYDCARGDKDLVVSTETSCWSGSICDMEALEKFYSGRSASPSYSSFINSGLIMGSILEIQTMLTYFVEKKNNFYILRKKQKVPFSSYDDQYALHEYINNYPNHVALDHHQILFGSFHVFLHLPNLKGQGTCEVSQAVQPEKFSFSCTDSTHFVSGFNAFVPNPQKYCNIERLSQLPGPTPKVHHRIFDIANEVLRTISPTPAIWHCQGVDGKIRLSKLETKVHKCLNDGKTAHMYGYFKDLAVEHEKYKLKMRAANITNLTK